MAKVKIFVTAKPKAGGLVAVHLDGLFVPLDKDGKDTETVESPPTDHWYSVSITGQPGDEVEYELTDNKGFKKKGLLKISGTNTYKSTYRVNFKC